MAAAETGPRSRPVRGRYRSTGPGLHPGTDTGYAVDGKEVELKQREFRLLEVFVGHTGRVLSKEELLDHLYSFDESPSPNAIETYVGRLRKKLQQSDLEIRTLRGLGYLLEQQHD